MFERGRFECCILRCLGLGLFVFILFVALRVF